MAKFNFFGDLFGKGKTVSDDIVGRRITINSKTISVDGKTVFDSAEGVVELRILEGTVEKIDSSCSVTIDGPVGGDVRAGMSVTCGDVAGKVDAEMSVNCGNIGGNADSGMSITARDIMGNADAGMTINARSRK
jgi:hypothetical protein